MAFVFLVNFGTILCLLETSLDSGGPSFHGRCESGRSSSGETYSLVIQWTLAITITVGHQEP